MRPAFDSPLVDRGVPGGLLSTESQFDLALLARLVDGNGDGTAQRDMGAFEYQRAAPKVTASAAPATAGQGQAITFNAKASDSRSRGDDRGDHVGVRRRRDSSRARRRSTRLRQPVRTPRPPAPPTRRA